MPDLSDDSSSNSQNSSQSSNSYVSSEDGPEEDKGREIVKPAARRERKEKEDPMPHKPKGAICSFFQYYHANIHDFMKKEGDNQKDAGSEFVRRASIKWKTLTDEEKEVYH
jgi:16S rRNA U516 pseudouridylate synthase RsuA-like enzyme